MKTTTINITELENYMKLVKLEQSFRVKLTMYKEEAKRQLKRAKDLKVLATTLNAHKSTLRKFKIDRELDKEIRKLMNRSFKGGVI